MEKLIQRLFHIDEEHPGRRKRLLVYFLAIASLFALFYIGVSFLHGIAIVRYGMLVDILIFCFLLWLLYKEISLRLVAQVFILVCWLTCLFLILISGGIRSAVMSWLTIIPAFALLLINRRSAWIWAILSCLLVLVFSVVEVTHFGLPYFELTGSIYFMMPVLLGIIILLTWINQIFDKQQENLLRAIEDANSQLKASDEELRQNIEELVSIQDALILREGEIINNRKKLEEYSMLLMRLAKSPRVQNGLVSEALEEICLLTATGMNTSRVSIWLLESDPTRITCVKLYQRAENSYSDGAQLFQQDYPAYFSAIMHEEIICAIEARKEAATKEFNTAYLEPLGIFSMLDSPVFLDGELAGVLCCEHCEAIRRWSAEDMIFAKSVADIIALMYKAAERIANEKEIREQRDEIASMNYYLEERVRDRTMELEKQNMQLTEYAFINSHMLRAPLSRILGLITLLNDAKNEQARQEIIQFIKISGEELDLITKKINDALAKGEHFNRQDFGN